MGGAGTKYIYIINNFCYNAWQFGGSSGIEVDDGASFVNIVGNIIINTRSYGVTLKMHDGTHGVQNIVVSANIIEGSDYGVSVAKVSGSELSDNQFITIDSNIIRSCEKSIRG